MKNEGQRTLSELPKEVQSDACQITQIEVGITLLVLVLLSSVPWCSDDISPNPAFSRPPLQISTELSVLSRSWRDDFSQYGVCTGQQTPESVLVRHRGRIIVRLGCLSLGICDDMRIYWIWDTPTVPVPVDWAQENITTDLTQLTEMVIRPGYLVHDSLMECPLHCKPATNTPDGITELNCYIARLQGIHPSISEESSN